MLPAWVLALLAQFLASLFLDGQPPSKGPACSTDRLVLGSGVHQSSHTNQQAPPSRLLDDALVPSPRLNAWDLGDGPVPRLAGLPGLCSATVHSFHCAKATDHSKRRLTPVTPGPQPPVHLPTSIHQQHDGRHAGML